MLRTRVTAQVWDREASECSDDDHEGGTTFERLRLLNIELQLESSILQPVLTYPDGLTGQLRAPGTLLTFYNLVVSFFDFFQQAIAQDAAKGKKVHQFEHC